MFTLNCKGRLLVVDKPLVMGVINITPDSFYEGSRFESTSDILKKAEQMLKDGAAILDIGGQSTRPGSERVTADDELRRLVTPVQILCKEFPDSFISVDTYHAVVAREAINAGACIVNDISAGTMDPEMIRVVASLHVPYILMHMKGNPENMQINPDYENPTKEVLDFFIFKTAELTKAGITDIVIDPGFGFGKTIQHNFEILKNLSLFKIIDLPILAGLSRKSTVYKTLGITADESLNGTTVLNTIALLNGANILRVHDVKETRQVVTLLERYRTA